MQIAVATYIFQRKIKVHILILCDTEAVLMKTAYPFLIYVQVLFLLW